ncbi:uncharacterized protein LOC124162876 [Ischnura elegans]|uniref:uncharacterized protein LOC124162876 n=1 Tax=Ischnura elegans TaxID=197161 RepID=UPI001ED875A6|nr:uncharacterized protein LOC124162876 [Ischnura elegans]
MYLGREENIPWAMVSYALFLTQFSIHGALEVNEIYFDFSYVRDENPRIEKLTNAAQNLPIEDNEILCTNAAFPQDVSCFSRSFLDHWTKIYLGFKHKSRKNVACISTLRREANATLENNFVKFTHSFTVCYPDDHMLKKPSDLPFIPDRIRNGEIELILDRRRAKFRMEDVKFFFLSDFKNSEINMKPNAQNDMFDLGNERVMLVSFNKIVTVPAAAILGKYESLLYSPDLLPCAIDLRGRCRG